MKKYIAEFVGTLVLTLFACGVAAVTGGELVATSLAFGLVIVAMAYSIGNVSGCHINPAVSFGLFIAGKLRFSELWKYVVAQVAGAFAGTGLLTAILGSNKALGANGFGNGALAANAGIAILVEVLLTFVFVVAILGVTDKKENSSVAGLVIGGTLTLVHLLGIKFTGTSVNPARSLAPAAITGGEALSQVWVFILAPLVGALLAGLFFKFVLNNKEK